MVSRPPPTVLTYIGKWAALLAIALWVASDSGLVLATAIAMAVLLAGLWRGSRVTWSVLLVLELGFLVSAPFEPPPWWALVLTVFALALLVAPATRRHVSGPPRTPREQPGQRSARRTGRVPAE